MAVTSWAIFARTFVRPSRHSCPPPPVSNLLWKTRFTDWAARQFLNPFPARMISSKTVNIFVTLADSLSTGLSYPVDVDTAGQ